MRRTLILFGAFLAAIAVGAGAVVAVYAAIGHDSTKTVVREVTVPSASPAVNETGLSVAQIYQGSYKGVVEITVSLPGGGAQGSGFVYDSNGHIVTNDHVVADSSSIKVAFPDGSTYPASLVGTDASTDLAVIKVDAPSSKLHALTLGDSSQLAVGDSGRRDRIAVRSRGDRDERDRQRAAPRHDLARTASPSRIPSRPTPRSTTATRAGRCSTRTAT